MLMMPPLKNIFLFLADPENTETLYILNTNPPYVIGRVVYLAKPMDWDSLKHRKPHIFKVQGYNIAIAYEKCLQPYDSLNDVVFSLPVMADQFVQHRINKHPLKFAQWKEGMKSIS